MHLGCSSLSEAGSPASIHGPVPAHSSSSKLGNGPLGAVQGRLVCHAGPPQLMMAFTAPGQLDPALLKARDEKYGIDSLKVAEHRRQVGLSVR